MKWQLFKSDAVPQDEVFLLAVGKDVFFARVVGKKLATRYSYSDLLGTMPRAYIEVFINNLAKQNIVPLWTEFKTPKWS